MFNIGGDMIRRLSAAFAATAFLLFLSSPQPARAAWVAGGIPVIGTAGEQDYAACAPDGQGGMIVVWVDYSHPSAGLYAQRIDLNGVRLWAAGGVPVGPQSNWASDPQIIADGNGGAIVAWTDNRSGVYLDVYADRISGNGTSLWNSSGVPVSTAAVTMSEWKLVAASSVGAILAWRDNRVGGARVYAQKLSGLGGPLWGAAGVSLCTNAADQRAPAVVSDGADGAIVAWRDSRAGERDLYAQRVNAAGSVLWGAAGKGVRLGAGDPSQPAIVGAPGSGAIVGWSENQEAFDNRIVAQKLSASGDTTWAGAAFLCLALNGKTDVRGVADGVGGAVFAWTDRRNEVNGDIYAQRVLSTGTADTAWPVNGIAVCNAPGLQAFRMISDLSGGAVFAWEDWRNAPNRDVYAQRVLRSGILGPGWIANGVNLCAGAAGYQGNMALCTDAGGGAFVVWDDERTNGTTGVDVYTMQVTASGAVASDPHWPVNGTRAANFNSVKLEPKAVSDGFGGVIVTWKDFRNGNFDVYASRVMPNGLPDPAWPAEGLAVCTSPDEQYPTAIASDGAGGAVIAWSDYRDVGTQSVDVYAQHVTIGGSLTWTPNGVPVATANGVQDNARITHVGGGVTVLAWTDGRNAGPNGLDVYVQRLSAGGLPQWTGGGVALIQATGDQNEIEILPGNAGRVWLSWSDRRSGTAQIYQLLVSTAGGAEAGWPLSGSAAAPNAFIQRTSRIATDGSGGVLAAWRELHGGNTDIAAQRMTPAGSPAAGWSASGTPICQQPQNQYQPVVAGDNAGGAFIAWADLRSGTDLDVYVQRVTSSGIVSAGWPVDGAAVCTAPGDQIQPEIIPDGSGGIILTWRDSRTQSKPATRGKLSLRGTPTPADTSLYCLRVTATGQVATGWPADGLVLCAVEGNKTAPTPIADGYGGVIVAWQDDRSGTEDVYLGKITGSGQTAPVTGVPDPSFDPAPSVIGRLLPPAPNPSQGQVLFRFQLLEASPVNLELFDVSGRLVRRVLTGEQFGVGNHAVSWDGRGTGGQTMPAGVYLLRLLYPGGDAVQRVLRLP